MFIPFSLRNENEKQNQQEIIAMWKDFNGIKKDEGRKLYIQHISNNFYY
jgi:hypothetical protein